LKSVPSAFDSTLFKPTLSKDRTLVVRTAAPLPSKELSFFFDLAERLPSFRFVLALVTCSEQEGYAAELRDLHRRRNSPVELLFDLPREKIAELVGRAGLYVHTAVPPGKDHATRIGMPISIAEAMATAAHVPVRDLPALISYVGNAGQTYSSLDRAAEIIVATAAWSEGRWTDAWKASVNRAFSLYADDLVIDRIHEDWLRLAGADIRNQAG